MPLKPEASNRSLSVFKKDKVRMVYDATMTPSGVQMVGRGELAKPVQEACAFVANNAAVDN